MTKFKLMINFICRSLEDLVFFSYLTELNGGQICFHKLFAWHFGIKCTVSSCLCSQWLAIVLDFKASLTFTQLNHTSHRKFVCVLVSICPNRLLGDYMFLYLFFSNIRNNAFFKSNPYSEKSKYR